MPSTNIIEKPAGIEKFAQNVFQLVHTKKSQWALEGTGGDSGIPTQYLHTCKIMFLDIKSRLYLGKDKGYMPTQFVIGASTHYVKDYWTDQDGNPVFDKLTKEKGKELGYEYQVGLESIYGLKGLQEEEGKSKLLKNGICFDKGVLDLRKYSDSPVLRQFVMEHEQNINAPNAKENRDPTRLKLFMFEAVIKENKALQAKVVEQFDENLDAMIFVGKLRTKTSGGFAYNEIALDAILAIIQEGIGLQAGEVAQKFEIVAKAVKVDGAAFLKIINEAMAEYRVELGKAAELNVLEYSSADAKMVVDGKKVLLQTFKTGTRKEDMLDELVFYFLGTPKGKSDFKDLRRSSETAKIKALSAGK